jgi:retinol dehydrogenase-12
MPSSLENLRSQLFFSPPVPTTDFSDKTVIVTGSNTGLGYEAAKHFIHLNASKVILAVRSLEKGEAAREKIIAAASSHISPERIEVWYVDLGIYRTVLEFCKRAEKLSRLDVLLLNAGIVALKFKILEDNESTITTNVVSPFLMLSLLLPKLQQTSACFKTLPHIVVVTSQMHEMAIFPPYKEGSLFSSINDEKTVKINDR